MSTSQSTSRPVWQHLANSQYWYVYFDDTLEIWKIGHSLTAASYYCFETVQWNPAQCIWTDQYGNLVSLNVSSNGTCPQYLNAQTTNAAQKTTTKKASTGLAIGLVFAILIVIVVGGVVYYVKFRSASNVSVHKQNTTVEQPRVTAAPITTAGPTTIATTGNPKRDSHSLELGKTQWETIDIEEHERQKQLQGVSTTETAGEIAAGETKAKDSDEE